MQESLLDDFVGHIEDSYDLAFADTARAIVRSPQTGCRGTRLVMMAEFAAGQVSISSSSLMENYGRALAVKRCGKCLIGDERSVFETLIRPLQELVGDRLEVAQFIHKDSLLDLIFLYRDGVGCGDIVAGLIKEWISACAGHVEFSRRDLSPVAGSHIHFHLQGNSVRH